MHSQNLIYIPYLMCVGVDERIKISVSMFTDIPAALYISIIIWITTLKYSSLTNFGIIGSKRLRMMNYYTFKANHTEKDMLVVHLYYIASK